MGSGDSHSQIPEMAIVYLSKPAKQGLGIELLIKNHIIFKGKLYFTFVKEIFTLLVALPNFYSEAVAFLTISSRLCRDFLWVWPWQCVALGFGNPPNHIQLPWKKILEIQRVVLFPKTPLTQAMYSKTLNNFLLTENPHWLNRNFPKSEIKREKGFLQWVLQINIKV